MVSLKKRDHDYLRFYARIGICVTRFQTIEDYLETIFSSISELPEEKSHAIFTLIRGLDTKLSMIGALACILDNEISEDWSHLSKRIAKCGEVRNDIAHCSPTSTGDPIVIIMDMEKKTSKVKTTGRWWLEARKKKKIEEKSWTSEQLKDEIEILNKLFSALIVFNKRLIGDDVSKHLLEDK